MKSRKIPVFVVVTILLCTLLGCSGVSDNSSLDQGYKPINYFNSQKHITGEGFQYSLNKTGEQEIIKLADPDTLANKLYMPLEDNYCQVVDKRELCTLIGSTLIKIGVTDISNVKWVYDTSPDSYVRVYDADCICTTESGKVLIISCLNLDSHSSPKNTWEIMHIKNKENNNMYYVYDDIAAMLYKVYNYQTDTPISLS